MFPFELEDFSAAAAYTPPDDIDREQLRLSTEEARRLIAQSGRYQLVDVGAVSDDAAKAGKLHDCDGCEARIAAGLNADQSMIGIVTRISRTDYAVDLQDPRRQIRGAGRCRADRPSRGRQLGLEPWRALADSAPSIGTVKPAPALEPPVIGWMVVTGRTSRIAKQEPVAHGNADETTVSRPRFGCRSRLLAGPVLQSQAQGEAPVLAVAEIQYVDTSGEVADQSADHFRRLREFEASLRTDLVASGKVRNVTLDCPPNACSIGDIDPGSCSAWRKPPAPISAISSFHKVSTLVQWAKVDLVEVKTRNVVFNRLVTFRGDNDKAWRHAEYLHRPRDPGSSEALSGDLMRSAATTLPRSP